MDAIDLKNVFCVDTVGCTVIQPVEQLYRYLTSAKGPLKSIPKDNFLPGLIQLAANAPVLARIRLVDGCAVEEETDASEEEKEEVKSAPIDYEVRIHIQNHGANQAILIFKKLDVKKQEILQVELNQSEEDSPEESEV